MIPQIGLRRMQHSTILWTMSQTKEPQPIHQWQQSGPHRHHQVVIWRGWTTTRSNSAAVICPLAAVIGPWSIPRSNSAAVICPSAAVIGPCSILWSNLAAVVCPSAAVIGPWSVLWSNSAAVICPSAAVIRP